MEKLTAILAVATNPGDVPLVLDKAASIARCFGSRIEVLVTDSETASSVAHHSAARDYANVTFCCLHRGQESWHEVILRRISVTHPDLVIKISESGLAPAKFRLHGKDWELANSSAAPVMLVRSREWSDPMRFAAALDVSQEDAMGLARSVLHAAGLLAMGTHGALDILYSEREVHDEYLRMERAVRLAQLVREFHVGCERIEMFSGEPGERLPPLLAARGYDVLILGGETRSDGLFDFGTGNVGTLVEASESDVVLVRPPDSEARFMSGDISDRAASASVRAVRAR
jgi:hypothetical protein